MSHPHRMHTKNPIKTSLVLVACLSFCAALHAGDSTLESNSPFLPHGYSNKKPEPPKPAPQVNGPLARELEFRGVVQLNGVYEFSLFQKKENRGYWIPENGSENGISVRNFNLDAMSLTVTLNGRTEQLTLMTPTDSPLPVATSPGAKPNKAAPKQPNIPGLNATKKPSSTANRVIPRRRVILPKKK